MEDGRWSQGSRTEVSLAEQPNGLLAKPVEEDGLPVCSQWQTVSAELLLAGLPFASRWSRGEEDVWLAASSSD